MQDIITVYKYLQRKIIKKGYRYSQLKGIGRLKKSDLKIRPKMFSRILGKGCDL